MAKTLVVLLVLMLAGLGIRPPGLAAAPEDPPTLEAFASMAAAGRLAGVRRLACPQGISTRLLFAAATDLQDQEWSVLLLSWRPHAALLILHYTPGPDGYADRAWADVDGDGIYEIAATGSAPDGIAVQLARVLRPSPCDLMPPREPLL